MKDFRLCSAGFDQLFPRRFNGAREVAKAVTEGKGLPAFVRMPAWRLSTQTELTKGLRRAFCFGTDNWIFDEHSLFISFWEKLTTIMVLMVAMITPVQVAFFRESETLSFVGLLNLCSEVIFAIDIVIQFFVPFAEPSGRITYKPELIAKNYLRGWFCIDVISVFPFHLLEGFSHFRAFKVLRVLRLVKLLGVVRAGRLFQHMEANGQVNHFMLEFTMLLLGGIFILHWMACCFVLVRSLECGVGEDEDPDCDNWARRYFHANASDLLDTEIYVAAAYWAAATISTLGYGDVVPVTTAECIFVTFGILIGVTSYSYAMGSVCSMVAKMDQRNGEFYAFMDNLNNFVREKGIVQDLSSRLREFFRYKKIGRGR
ncbi:hypothetical protein CYMTET_51896, partial [Cymbomonas tetramitiformis]